MRNRLPGLALAGLVLTAGAGALAQAEAERRLDAAIARLRAALGPDARLEIGRRQVDPVSGRAVLSDVVLTEGQGRLAIPELRLVDVSDARIGRAEALRPVFRDASGLAGEAARLLVAGLPLPPPGGKLDLSNLAFDAVEAEAFRMEEPARGTLRLGRVALRDWRPEGIGAGTLEGFDYTGAGPEPQALRLGRAVLEAVVLPVTRGEFDPVSFRAARLGLEGTELRDPTRKVSLTLGRVALADWIPGRPSELAIEGVQVGAPAGQLGQGELRLGRMGASGLDLARIARAVVTQTQVPDPVPGVLQRMFAEGIEFRGDGQPVLSLGRLHSEGRLEAGVLHGLLAAEGFRLSPPPGQGALLRELGYAELAGRLEFGGSLPRAGGTLAMEPAGIAWDGAGALGITARVEDFPAPPPEGTAVDRDAKTAEMAASRLGALTLTWREQGLLGRVLAQQARQQRVPEARLREQWAQMALGMPIPGSPPPRRGGPGAKDAVGAPDAFTPIREALAAFIRQPGTLEISLRPPEPLPLLKLPSLAAEGPAQAVQRLGLTAVAR